MDKERLEKLEQRLMFTSEPSGNNIRVDYYKKGTLPPLGEVDKDNIIRSDYYEYNPFYGILDKYYPDIIEVSCVPRRYAGKNGEGSGFFYFDESGEHLFTDEMMNNDEFIDALINVPVVCGEIVVAIDESSTLRTADFYKMFSIVDLHRKNH